jgi:hypothetical protein
VGFFLLAAGWALVTPINGFPDEADHVDVAVAIVRGEVFPHVGAYAHGTGAITNVPVSIRELVSGQPCQGLQWPSLCRVRAGHPGSVTVISGSGRNYPLYYAAVGWPSLLSASRTGWYLMRLVSAALCAVFFAAGLSVLVSLRIRPLLVLSAACVGLTPIALNLAGAINPNGLEIASGLCFWAVILALFRGTSEISMSGVTRLGIVSGIVFASCRFVSVLWIVLAVVFCLVAASREERRRFRTSRAAHLTLASAAVAALVMGAWTLAFRSYETFSDPQRDTRFLTVVRLSADGQPKIVQQMLGYLGWLQFRPPIAADVCWAVALLAFAMLVLKRHACAGWVALVGVVFVLVMPFLIMVATFPTHGNEGWQGRYTLPLALGLPLLAVVLACPPIPNSRPVITLSATVIALTLVAHVVVFDEVWSVYRHTGHGYAPLGRALLIFGGATLFVTFARADRQWRPKHVASPTGVAVM